MTQRNPRRSRRRLSLQGLRENEDGDARLFVELHRGRFLYDHAAGVWYKWNGHYWVEDFLNEVMAGIEEVISVYGQTAQREAWLRLQAEKSGNQAKAKIHEQNENDLMKRVRPSNPEQEKERPGTGTDRRGRPGDYRPRMGPGPLAFGLSEWGH